MQWTVSQSPSHYVARYCLARWIAFQPRELTKYVTRRGWTLAATYEDTMSGANAKRPGLDTLMTDVRLRKSDVVLVWKLDRFGRLLVNCAWHSGTGCARSAVQHRGFDREQSSPTARLSLHIRMPSGTGRRWGDRW